MSLQIVCQELFVIIKRQSGNYFNQEILKMIYIAKAQIKKSEFLIFEIHNVNNKLLQIWKKITVFNHTFYKISHWTSTTEFHYQLKFEWAILICTIKETRWMALKQFWTFSRKQSIYSWLMIKWKEESPETAKSLEHTLQHP